MYVCMYVGRVQEKVYLMGDAPRQCAPFPVQKSIETNTQSDAQKVDALR